MQNREWVVIHFFDSEVVKEDGVMKKDDESLKEKIKESMLNQKDKNDDDDEDDEDSKDNEDNKGKNIIFVGGTGKWPAL